MLVPQPLHLPFLQVPGVCSAHAPSTLLSIIRTVCSDLPYTHVQACKQAACSPIARVTCIQRRSILEGIQIITGRLQDTSQKQSTAFMRIILR